MTWLALAGWGATVVALWVGWQWRSGMASLQDKLARGDRNIDAMLANSKQLSEELFQSRIKANGWLDQLVRLEAVISARDKELMRYADALDRCTDPSVVGTMLRARLREPLPVPIGTRADLACLKKLPQ